MNCAVCDGTGYLSDECGTCGRAGWIEDDQDGGTMTCPDCDGDADQTCDECEGTGQELD
jgi:DnaJ-class molecular chaperone